MKAKVTCRDEAAFILCSTDFDDACASSAQPEDGILTVFYKALYVPVYTPPAEVRLIRDLQLLMRRENPFDRPCRLVMNLTEWLGHEQEELFITLVKYLTDKAGQWSFHFLVRDADSEDLRRMYVTLRCFMKGSIRQDLRWSSRHSLQTFLEDTCRIEREAADLLAAVLWDSPVTHVRSDAFIHSLVEEIQPDTRRPVNKERLLGLLGDPDCTLGMIADPAFIRHIESEGRE